MAMTVLITLTTAGADTGPFDLYSNVDGYVTPFETGVAKIDLVSGYTSILVPDSTTIIRVQSTALCTNYVDLPIGGTTTTTTSTTTTPPPTILYVRGRDVGGLLNVSLYVSIDGGFPIDLGVIDGLSCFDIDTIPGLAIGSVVTFTTSTSCVMRGAVSSTCPTMAGSATTYSYTIVAGPQTVSLTINSTIIP